MIFWSFEFTQQSPTCWSPGPLASPNNHPPGDLLVLWVHTTITYLVISSSFGFTQQSPAWWYPGPLSSHNNHCFTTWKHLLHDFPEMVLQQKGKVVWALQPFSQTEILQQSPAWWSPGPLGSHNSHAPADILVLWVHTTITCLVPWVHTTITCLVISRSSGFTQQSPSWWSPGPSGSHNNHPPGNL